jgi:hypothetical protein
VPLTIIRPFDVTIPPGTTKAAPLVTPTVFDPNVVESIRWRFPNGCNGFVGIQIGARGVPVLPGGIGHFLVHNGDTTGYDIEGHHTTGDWSVIGYNLGTFAHTIHVEFKVHRNTKVRPDLFILGDASSILALGES